MSTNEIFDSAHGEDLESYGRFTNPAYVREINPTDSGLGSYLGASHVLLWAKTNGIAVHKLRRRAIVLMQMRFDGHLGFPGGLVDEGETPAQGATRELVEEIAYDCDTFGEIKEEDRLFSHADDTKKLVMHFYSKELTEDQVLKVISNSQKAQDFGDESLGFVQVPLYTMNDNYRGLPAFLRNNFIGNAKLQLTSALSALNLLTDEEVKSALNAKVAEFQKQT